MITNELVAERLRQAEALLRECLEFRGIAQYGVAKLDAANWDGELPECSCDGCRLKRKLESFLEQEQTESTEVKR